MAVDSMPTASPVIRFVAAPVSLALAIYAALVSNAALRV